MNNENALGNIFAGLITAEVGCQLFDNKPVYIGGIRIHHYQIGLALMLLSLIAIKSKDENARKLGLQTGLLGAGIFLHDSDDFVKDVRRLLS